MRRSARISILAGAVPSAAAVTAAVVSGVGVGASAHTHPQSTLERIALGSGGDTGDTWFTVHPTRPDLAVFSAHEEWNEHRLVVARGGPLEWTPVATAPFSGEHSDRAARFTPDGRLLFSSRRPGAGDWDLWIVQLDGDEWGSPAPLPAPINTEHRDYHGSMTRDGTIYFISTRPGGAGEGDIYRATRGADGYRVERLPDGINTDLWEVDVFASPDERLLVFARTDDPTGLGGDDLFVSVRSRDGWSPPRRLDPPINSSEYDYGARVSAGGTHLTFTSHREDVARVYRAPLDLLGLASPDAVGAQSGRSASAGSVAVDRRAGK